MMSRIFVTFVSLWVLMFGAIAGCDSSTDSQDAMPGPGGKADDASGGEDSALVGTYKLDTEDFGGTLEILSASETRIEFNLTVVGRFGSGPMGDVVRAVAEPTDGGQLVWWPSIGADCQIYFGDTAPEAIELIQVGECRDAGFGANVDGSGVYTRESAEESTLEGTYKLDTDDFGGTLEILSASETRIEFNLTVVGRFGSGPMGDVVRAVAEPTDGGQLVWWPSIGADCQIYFGDTAPEAIELIQVGACSDAGFGRDVDGSGVYTRE